MSHVRFGILSTANIGINQVIPAMQKGSLCEVTGISSRNSDKAENAAKELGIPKHYGSYEAMLEDPDIDAVYNPLPNHLHVPMTIRALEAGKHVLCEKPVAMTADEAEELLEASRSYPDLKVMEAFMYRFQPRWDRVKELIANGTIGEIKAIHSLFTYFNDDPQNIRNIPEMGGGGLMDIGCYCINSARYLFEREPQHVSGFIDTDPDLGVDRLASGLLDFGNASAVFSCSMRSPGYQYMKVFGTSGHIHMEWPFNPAPDKPSSLILDTDGEQKTETFDPVDHYTLQGDRFSEAILNDTAVPTPLEDAVANMKVIEEIRRSR